MSEWSLRLQTPTSQLTAQLPHGATIKVLREHVAALTGLDDPVLKFGLPQGLLPSWCSAKAPPRPRRVPDDRRHAATRLSVPLGPAAADAVLHDVRERQLPGGGGAGGDGRSADDRPPRPVSEDSCGASLARARRHLFVKHLDLCGMLSSTSNFGSARDPRIGNTRPHDPSLTTPPAARRSTRRVAGAAARNSRARRRRGLRRWRRGARASRAAA